MILIGGCQHTKINYCVSHIVCIMLIHFCHKFRNDLGNKIKHELGHL